MKVLHRNVLIKADDPEQKTESGLILAEQWKTLPPTGEVLETGPEVKHVKKGDHVIFRRYAATELYPHSNKPDEMGLRLCDEQDVLAIL